MFKKLSEKSESLQTGPYSFHGDHIGDLADVDPTANSPRTGTRIRGFAIETLVDDRGGTELSVGLELDGVETDLQSRHRRAIEFGMQTLSGCSANQQTGAI